MKGLFPRFVKFASVALCIGFAASCSGDHPKPAADAGKSEPAGVATVSAPDESEQRGGGTPTADGADEALKLVDLEGYKAELAKHKGKVVLVDFWATWCVPCVSQFPHTVELSRKHKGAGLDVISVSMDDPAAKAKVLDFLKKQGGEFDNLLANFPEGVNAFEVLELDGDSIPHYKLYDRDGKLHKKLFIDETSDKVLTAEDIDHAVEELLAKKDAS